MNGRGAIRVHPLIAAAIVGLIVSLEGWALKEIVSLKENVAGLSAQIATHIAGEKRVVQNRP